MGEKWYRENVGSKQIWNQRGDYGSDCLGQCFFQRKTFLGRLGKTRLCGRTPLSLPLLGAVAEFKHVSADQGY